MMETAAERVADGDKAVRGALRDLLGSTLLPAMGPAALAPFVPLLMAHVCAAMTHLAEPIRWGPGLAGSGPVACPALCDCVKLSLSARLCCPAQGLSPKVPF